MCFNALVDGEYDEKPLVQLLREELASALKVGTVSALVVLVVLATGSTPAWLVAGASVGAVFVGIALHQAVMVASVSVLRLQSNRTVTLTETKA